MIFPKYFFKIHYNDHINIRKNMKGGILMAKIY